jgi:hypothetical protein
MISNKDILDRVIQGMAHVQDPGDIRRGDYYTERVLIGVWFCRKKILFFPELIPFIFAFLGIITDRKLIHLTIDN